MIEMPIGGDWESRDGTQLRVEVHSSTDPKNSWVLVWAHGFGGSRRNFRACAAKIRDLCHVVLYDARGHGGSPLGSTERARVGFDALVDDLETILTRFAGAHLIVGGLSLGAATALALAARRPEMVRGIVLASPPAGGARTRSFALDLAESLGAGLGIRGRGTRLLPELGEMKEGLRMLIERGMQEHDEGSLRALLHYGVAQIPPLWELPGFSSVLAIPSILLAGEHDPNAVKTAIELGTHLPRAHVEILRGAGHVVNLSAPRDFERVLRCFVLRCSSGEIGYFSGD